MRVQRADGTWIEIGDLGGQIYGWNAPDGSQWYWSIVAATAFAHARDEVVMISLGDMGMTPELLLRQYPELDVAYALTTDISQPLLFVPLEGKVRLIDGSHRVCKALMLGVDILPACFLTQEEADQSLVARLPPGRGLDLNATGKDEAARPVRATRRVRVPRPVRHR